LGHQLLQLAGKYLKIRLSAGTFTDQSHEKQHMRYLFGGIFFFWQNFEANIYIDDIYEILNDL